MGLQSLTCPSFPGYSSIPLLSENAKEDYKDGVKINGKLYNISFINGVLENAGFSNLTIDWLNQDISRVFTSSICDGSITDSSKLCSATNPFPGSPSYPSNRICIPSSVLNSSEALGRLTLTWPQIKQSMVVVSNSVLDLTSFFENDQAFWAITPDLALQLRQRLGADATILLARSNPDFMNCLRLKYTVAYIDSKSLGCTFYSSSTTIALTVILMVILVRFIMAFLFHWFIAPKQSKSLSTRVYVARDDATLAQSVPLDSDMYTICLVTCYSEDESAIKVCLLLFKGTLDSIAATSYPDERKLLFVICDGLIHGKGNPKSTPDTVVGLITQNRELGVPEARSYIAIAGIMNLTC